LGVGKKKTTGRGTVLPKQSNAGKSQATKGKEKRKPFYKCKEKQDEATARRLLGGKKLKLCSGMEGGRENSEKKKEKKKKKKLGFGLS